MNTPHANSQVERKRKNAVVLCKSIRKILEANIEGQIDSYLDEALDRLAEVHMAMHETHEKALKERAERLKLEEAAEIALLNGRANATKITRKAPDKEKKELRGFLAKLTADERREIARLMLQA